MDNSVVPAQGGAFRTVRHPWGTVVHRTDTGRPVSVYHSKSTPAADYLARVEHSPLTWPRSWEEAVFGVGAPIIATAIGVSSGAPAFWPLLLGVGAGVAGAFLARPLAARATTARRLDTGRAIGALVATGNDELIAAAIDTVISFDVDPAGAVDLVAELDAAWRAAEASSVHEKAGVIAALRDTAAHFPTTDGQVATIRSELRSMRRSLASLDTAKRELDAATSTADLLDPVPPRGIDALRAATQAIEEDAEVVRAVADEQTAARRLEP